MHPLLLTDTRASKPTISFRHLCFLERPTSWPVSQLYKEIMSPTSALQALYNALVTDITVCHPRGVRAALKAFRLLLTHSMFFCPSQNLLHEYLILCIRSSDPNSLNGLGRVWARCEREPDSRSSSGVAADTITFSIERPKLRAHGDKAIMECAFDSLKIEHMADLLKIVHDIAPRCVVSPSLHTTVLIGSTLILGKRYEKASHNSWWFAVITVGALQTLRTDWTIKPSKEWISKAIEALNTASTRARSQEISRLFANHWHPTSVPPVSLCSYQAWGVPAERPRPVVPPKLKPVSCSIPSPFRVAPSQHIAACGRARTSSGRTSTANYICSFGAVPSNFLVLYDPCFWRCRLVRSPDLRGATLP